MLHRILLMSGSGMILFVKEYYTTQSLQSVKSTQLGGIICAMYHFVRQHTNMNIQYIQCDTISIAFFCDINTNIICAVIHDTNDTQYIGELLCQHIIDTFTQQYHKLLTQSINTIQTDQFSEFSSKIYSITRVSIKPILVELEQVRGILLVLVTNINSDTLTTAGIMSNGTLINQTTDNGKLNINMMNFAQMQSYQPTNLITPHNISNNLVKSNNIDKLTVLANHQALINTANGIMNKQNDMLTSITLRSRRSTMYIQRIDKCSLIVLMKNSVDPATCMAAIDKATKSLHKLLQISTNIKT